MQQPSAPFSRLITARRSLVRRGGYWPGAPISLTNHADPLGGFV